MSMRRLLAAAFGMVVFSLVWNAFVHMVVLREAERALAALARPAIERSMALALALAMTAMLALLFAWSFAVTAGPSNVRRGLAHGLFFACLAGLLVDLNQFILYPIPATLALSWFGFAVFEFCAWGLIAAKMFNTRRDGQSSAGLACS